MQETKLTVHADMKSNLTVLKELFHFSIIESVVMKSSIYN